MLFSATGNHFLSQEIDDFFQRFISSQIEGSEVFDLLFSLLKLVLCWLNLPLNLQQILWTVCEIEYTAKAQNSWGLGLSE